MAPRSETKRQEITSTNWGNMTLERTCDIANGLRETNLTSVNIKRRKKGFNEHTKAIKKPKFGYNVKGYNIE